MPDTDMNRPLVTVRGALAQRRPRATAAIRWYDDAVLWKLIELNQ